MKEIPGTNYWVKISSIFIVMSTLFGFPIWAYSTFVTKSERESSRQINLPRIVGLEEGQKQTNEKLGIIEGKIDFLIDLYRKKNR